MNTSFVCITPLSSSHPSVLGFKTVGSSLFFCPPSSINMVSNNTWVELASVSVSHLFFVSLSDFFSSSLYSARLSFQPRSHHYPPIPSSPPNSHLHNSPPRLTILFSVSIISEVFSLDTAMTSRLHCNKSSYYSPSVFLSSFLPIFRSLFHPQSFVPNKMLGRRHAPPFSVARPRPLLAAKEQWTGFGLPLSCSANPPGGSHQIELPLCVICMRKKQKHD